MYQDAELKAHFESSPTISAESAIIAEWNMNISSNIFKIGNYRYRPNSTSKYRTLANTFDEYDDGTFYTGATEADVVVDGGYTNNNVPTTFISKKEKEALLYSLEDCFGRFRPRSGINKLRYFTNKYTHFSTPEMANRPRYYIADKDDKFKYWTSFRTEDGVERGIATTPIGNSGTFQIDDAVPFVVYQDPVPANRVVVKMQTNVGSVDLGPFSTASSSFDDPFYGSANQTTPIKWKIQYLENDSWTDAISFDSNSVRKDGTKVIKDDGYVEVSYGLIVPEIYSNIFVKAETLASDILLPDESVTGYAYLIKSNPEDIGKYYIWTGSSYETFVPTYGWYLSEDSAGRNVSYVTELVSPDQYTSTVDGKVHYREFQYVEGIRLVIESMNKFDSTFDLIELSPRLAVNMADRTLNYTISKTASDLGVSGLPVGQLLASTGNISIFDYDQAFNKNNTSSIVSKYLNQNIQFKFYEIIKNVGSYDYYVPIKVMYSEGFPDVTTATRQVSLTLRDLFFYFEAMTAPQMLLQNVSMSYAVSTMLDYIGFSNYKFYRVSGETEVQIPYFFVAPDKTVAQVLNDIAISTQTAMFFDEENNFISMSKNYIMPEQSQRATDLILYGSKDQSDTGVRKNYSASTVLPNIMEVSSTSNTVFNDGKINYVSRSIQKSAGSIKQASMVDKDRSWVYKPVLLWEIAGTDAIKSINNEVSTSSEYVLAAIPLNSTLTDQPPSVSNFKLINNVMDLGEGVYWITRYNGYFYSNGEIIKFDAVQFNIPNISSIDPDNPNIEGNNVWISSVQEYQSYFAKMPFNGKIYPTGLVRIYSEPNYEVITADGSILSPDDQVPSNATVRLKNGPVAKHGRGQFGTEITSHQAGLSSNWSSNDYVRGCTMQAQYLFTNATVPATEQGAAGLLNPVADKSSNDLAKASTRNGITKNFLSSSFIKESDIDRLYATQTGTVQSSALIFNGPSLSNRYAPLAFISYIYKPLNHAYNSFGTRVRIVGKSENSDKRDQTPLGTANYYVTTASQPNQNVVIGGASGGIGVMVNPETNNGYYFEIAALTESNLSAYEGEIQNVIFYKIMKRSGSSEAIPVKLWGGLTNILVDDGNFTAQYRVAGEENPTVYDLSVEYQDVGSVRTFFLYINSKLIATVNDVAPLPIYNNIALFTRGASRLMFENVYAISNNHGQNTASDQVTPINSVFSDKEDNATEAFNKYAMSGIIKSVYLSGISSLEPPRYKLYFEEFGTIMREMAYLNIRYKSYPALYAKMSPTFNRIKGYTVSGFIAGAYGAEFLVFNATDTALSLDSQTGNYLRIQGITFTQENSNELSVDEFFSKKSDFSDPQLIDKTRVESPQVSKREYQDIKNSRVTYGRKEFTLDVPYIQTSDDANNLMSWVVSKVMKPRMSVGVKIFPNPAIQLGDIVQISYKDNNGVDAVAPLDSRFVVYNIEYNRSVEGPDMTIYLSEVA